ncbi:hypothetical protein [Nocardia asiatica]|nr:hypothetical protein [Nocardia asiatica]
MTGDHTALAPGTSRGEPAAAFHTHSRENRASPAVDEMTERLELR